MFTERINAMLRALGKSVIKTKRAKRMPSHLKQLSDYIQLQTDVKQLGEIQNYNKKIRLASQQVTHN